MLREDFIRRIDRGEEVLEEEKAVVVLICRLAVELLSLSTYASFISVLLQQIFPSPTDASHGSHAGHFPGASTAARFARKHRHRQSTLGRFVHDP